MAFVLKLTGRLNHVSCNTVGMEATMSLISIRLLHVKLVDRGAVLRGSFQQCSEKKFLCGCHSSVCCLFVCKGGRWMNLWIYGVAYPSPKKDRKSPWSFCVTVGPAALYISAGMMASEPRGFITRKLFDGLFDFWEGRTCTIRAPLLSTWGRRAMALSLMEEGCLISLVAL